MLFRSINLTRNLTVGVTNGLNVGNGTFLGTYPQFLFAGTTGSALSLSQDNGAQIAYHDIRINANSASFLTNDKGNNILQSYLEVPILSGSYGVPSFKRNVELTGSLIISGSERITGSFRQNLGTGSVNVFEIKNFATGAALRLDRTFDYSGGEIHINSSGSQYGFGFDSYFTANAGLISIFDNVDYGYTNLKIGRAHV